MKTKLFAWTSWITFLVSAVAEWGLDIDWSLTPGLWLLIAAVLCLASTARAALSTNAWSVNDGKWEIGSNWSHGVPAPTNNEVLIVNNNPMGGGSTTVDVATVVSSAGNNCLTVSNLTVGGTILSPHRLFLNNANNTPGTIGLVVLNSFTITSHGSLVITNSRLRVEAPHDQGKFIIDSSVLLLSGSIVSSNEGSEAEIGFANNGILTMSNGTVQLCSLAVGGFVAGTLQIAGGTNEISGTLNLGVANTATGTIWQTGGQLVTTNFPSFIATAGNGQITVSNGEALLRNVYLGNGGQATLTVDGGTMFVRGDLDNPGGNRGLMVGSTAHSTGAVWVTGGQLLVTNSTTGISLGRTTSPPSVPRSGSLTQSNGIVRADIMYVGQNCCAEGTLTVAGGTNIIGSGGLIIDTFPGTASVWITGGQLVVTNKTLITVGNQGHGQLTVSNGTLLASDIFVGTTNSGLGTLTIAGGTVVLREIPFFSAGALELGNDVGTTGAVWVTGGQLFVTNGEIVVGNRNPALTTHGVGFLTQSNGLINSSVIAVGGADNSVGTLTIAGGTHMAGICAVGNGAHSTGALWLKGGSLITGEVNVAPDGDGQMTVSNGTLNTIYLTVSEVLGTAGTITVAGGTNTVSAYFIVGSSTTGTVWMTGGQLATTGAVTTVGAGRITVSNGTWRASDVFVGYLGEAGTMTLVGGTTSINSNLVIGDCPSGTAGYVSVQGGSLFVTNTTHTAVTDLRDSLLSVTAGQLVMDKLVITNACGHFFHGGGTLTVGTVLLDPNLDADGDGLPNGWEQVHGLDPLESAGDVGAAGDPDHDGFTNLEEYQAGTDPQDPNSNPLRITSIVRQSNDVLLTWLTAGGKTNVVQFTKGSASGSYSNNFADLSGNIVSNVVGLTSETYLDVGGATNTPSRYYRVRLVP